MGNNIRIHAGDIVVTAELNDTPTAEAIAAALPFETTAQTWGDEVWFPIPVVQELAHDAANLVNVGDLGYWPRGKAFCIFFGPTPASRGDEVRPASAVNVIGKVLGDALAFKTVRDGDPVRLEIEN